MKCDKQYCCCKCRNLAMQFLIDRQDLQIGWTCLAPDLYDVATGRSMVFSDMAEHGECEMFQEMEKGTQ